MDYEVDMRNEGGPVSNSIKDLVLVDEMDLDSGVDCSRVFVEYLPLDHEDTLKLAHKSAYDSLWLPMTAYDWTHEI